MEERPKRPLKSFPTNGTPLVRANEDSRLFVTKAEITSVRIQEMFEYYPETTIDKESLLLIQIEDLHKAVDHTTTATGSATLFRSLIRPPLDPELIWAKQESLRELESNDKLRNAINGYLHEFKNGETALFKFLNENIYPHHPYADFKSAMKAGENILRALKVIPEPESTYSKYLVDSIKGYEDSSTFRLMRGPIYTTFRGLASNEDVHALTPRLKFAPSRITIGTIVPSLPFIASLGGGLSGLVSSELIQSNPDFALFIWCATTGPIFSFYYGTIMKPQMDYSSVIKPLREKTVKDDLFVGSIDAVGKLDELLSFTKFAKSTRQPVTIPEITDDNFHHFTSQDLTNPVLGKKDKNFVSNSIDLNNSRLTFITGPNSGGKTTICRSIFQNQILGQIGSYVLASRAEINVSDRMAYQAPKFDSLQDEEGRFGTELKRTKEIFFQLTPKSLFILDELAEGTTIEEKWQISKVILNGLNTIGNTTILVTHNHELVDDYRREGKGQFLQVEFDKDKPTHRIVTGVSKESHADQVAKKIGFSERDIEKHLKQRGYIK